MDQYNVKTVTERLRADRKLSTLFSVMQGYGETAAARWADRDGEHGMTFAELAVRADDCAARLHSLNPKYRDIVVSSTLPLRVLGKVLS